MMERLYAMDLPSRTALDACITILGNVNSSLGATHARRQRLASLEYLVEKLRKEKREVMRGES